MDSDSIDVIDEVNRLVSTGVLTVETLHLILRIDRSRLRAALAERTVQTNLVDIDRQILTNDEIMRLSTLTAHLAGGMEIADDVRLKAMLESLITEMNFDSGSIARLTGIPVECLELVIKDVAAVPSDVKYAMAIRCSYLVNALNMARGH